MQNTGELNTSSLLVYILFSFLPYFVLTLLSRVNIVLHVSLYTGTGCCTHYTSSSIGCKIVVNFSRESKYSRKRAFHEYSENKHRAKYKTTTICK